MRVSDSDRRTGGVLRRCIAALESTNDRRHDMLIEQARDELKRLVPDCQHDVLKADTTIEIWEHGVQKVLGSCRSCGTEVVHQFAVARPR